MVAKLEGLDENSKEGNVSVAGGRRTAEATLDSAKDLLEGSEFL